jgi:hypothetical protein
MFTGLFRRPQPMCPHSPWLACARKPHNRRFTALALCAQRPTPGRGPENENPTCESRIRPTPRLSMVWAGDQIIASLAEQDCVHTTHLPTARARRLPSVSSVDDVSAPSPCVSAKPAVHQRVSKLVTVRVRYARVRPSSLMRFTPPRKVRCAYAEPAALSSIGSAALECT